MLASQLSYDKLILIAYQVQQFIEPYPYPYFLQQYANTVKCKEHYIEVGKSSKRKSHNFYSVHWLTGWLLLLAMGYELSFFFRHGQPVIAPWPLLQAGMYYWSV